MIDHILLLPLKDFIKYSTAVLKLKYKEHPNEKETFIVALYLI